MRHARAAQLVLALAIGLVLGPAGYSWRFGPPVGSFTDSGSGFCH